jgi:hypothetical protein
MSVPIHLIMGAVSVLQAHSAAQSRKAEAQHALTLRQAELEVERDRFQAEIAAADRQAERQMNVLLRIIETAENIHRMKVEAIVAMFKEAKSLLQEHQNILGQEKAAMNRQLTETEISPQRHVFILKRQAEVDIELRAIDGYMTDLTESCVETVSNIRPDLSFNDVKALVEKSIVVEMR